MAKKATKSKHKRMFIRCPSCNGIYLELNKHYSPKKTIKGYMLDLLPEYGSEGWNWEKTFSDHDEGPALECPWCNSPLVFDPDQPFIQEGNYDTEQTK